MSLERDGVDITITVYIRLGRMGCGCVYYMYCLSASQACASGLVCKLFYCK